jgi:hypothetical protein
MAGVIVLSDFEVASNTDILSGTRLQTVPSGGFLTFEMQASASDSVNFVDVSIQMPNGDTPLNNVRIPATANAENGIIDDRHKTMITLPIQQGGHTVFSAARTGASNLSWRVTYSPA